MKIGALERFSAADLGALSRLPATVGWADTEADWRTILATGLAFGHRNQEGEIISSGVLFLFDEVATIGKMIVHPDCRGRGLAREVMTACLAARSPTIRHTTLIATPLGEPVYLRLGFSEIGRIHKLFAPSLPPSLQAGVTSPARLDEARVLDFEAFGADRGLLLAGRLAQSTASATLRDEHGTPTGFAMVTEAIGFSTIGPLIAPSLDGALRLVRALGTPARLRIDVPASQPAFVEALQREGFAQVDFPPEMSLGGTRAPGNRTKLFALASQAVG